MENDELTIQMKKSDLKLMVASVKRRGLESKRAAALGLLEGVLQESSLDDRTRFLIEQVKELLDYDES